ncbi:patatin-like phospholipase family protein [Cellulomonas sp. PhB143]|uniref:patatin-like phospholipase family protein n=1 Tax=Cellulomonas sp. PhB143 TaxID=2485186 RepID=UPI000FAD0C66|nr:patatin-like phospholipase family protein [Cellulomonas sp. PhB143]ROS72147.1 NTE family protein [Cellulomonas sp. PhB143]
MSSAPFATRHVRPASAGGPAGPGDRPPAGSPQDERTQHERALVLGGGGSAGNAWLVGVVAGLFEGGLDLSDADLIVGTSAGSTAAAQLTGASPSSLLADILAAGAQRPPRPVASGTPHAPAAQPSDHLRRTDDIIAGAGDPADMRRRLGAAALDMEKASDGSRQARWRDTVAARLPSADWPRQPVLITAVEAHTGDPVVFDRHSGIDLADAVAASCASGLPHGIGESRYIDGGYRRSSENADLAAGYARVLVLSPLGGRSRAPRSWDMHLEAQVGELRASGSEVETVVPDSRALEAFGSNLMDLSTRPSAARAGRDQGREAAEHIAALWH